ACWFRSLAETIFNMILLQRGLGSTQKKFAIAGRVRSPDPLHGPVVRTFSWSRGAMCFFEVVGPSSCSLRFLPQHRHLCQQKFGHLIARVRLRIPRADAESPCLSCKMAEQFLSVMRMEDRRAEGGRSSAGRKVFGESPPWLRCTMDYSGSKIPFPTRSLNGRMIHVSRGSRFVSCLIRPTVSKAPRVFSAHRSETGTPWQFGCRASLNLARHSSMGQVIFRFFPSCYAGN